jgi:AraC family transcriptional regulator, regulatory protein of adaptative response / methylated-DNA-[protein]-cysteine methyltransferase
MIRAMLASDKLYEGIFYTAVQTTGIFCRPTCPARKPKPENVVFYKTAEDALAAGYRPCLRCKPLDAIGAAPEWVAEVLREIDRVPNRRWTDDDMIRLNVDPLRLRRWFKEHFGTTFHTHIRARRLALALDSLKQGSSIDDAALDHGYKSISGFREAFQGNMQTTPGHVRGTRLLFFTRVLTPLGPMIAMAEERGLVLLEFIDRPALSPEVEELRSRHGYTVAPGRNAHLGRIEEEITAYFAGTLQDFSVPLVTPGTEFQRRVWSALQSIPFGATESYGSLAKKIGNPNACRAVGHANGQNRIAIVIPCHRVIGVDGSLTGYGGGQHRKAFLLDLERKAGCSSELVPGSYAESIQPALF